MTKIVLLLSREWDATLTSMIGPDDVVLCAPGNRPKVAGLKILELPKVSVEHEQFVSDWLARTHSSNANSPAAELVTCFLNDFYSYSLRPMVALFLGLKVQIELTGFSEVVVIMAKSDSAHIPMVGFQTTESLRGSPDLLASRFGNMLPSVFPNINFRYRFVAGDYLCSEVVRRMVVSTANSLFFVLFGLKTICLNWGRKSNRPGNGAQESLVLVRTEHQVRFAQRLMAGNPAVGVAVFPQVSQGSMRSLFKLREGVELGRLAEKISLGMIGKAALRTFSNVRQLKRYASTLDESTLAVAGLNIPVRLADIANEISLVSVAIFYKNILSEFLAQTAPKRCINFELVGRMAGLEALAARENQVVIYSVQTALISSVPHPIFPYSDCFYTDSATTRTMIAEIGSIRKGEVEYSGPPYPLRPLSPVRAVRTIAFFSQPYEHEITIDIVAALCRWARLHAARISMRLHPRDRCDRYDALLSEYPGLLHHEDSMGIIEMIEAHDVCVTRTSSIAKEAVALGSAILLCRWSAFDRSVKADYIVSEPGFEYCAGSEAEMVAMLDNPTKLGTCAAQLGKRMFGGKSSVDLAARLFVQR